MLKTILMLCLIMLIPLTVKAEPVRIVDNIEDAYFLSKDLNKDALIIFTADWCINCATMKKDIDNNISILDNKIVCYINIDRNEYYKNEYKVKNIPDYFLLRDGIELNRKVGYKNITNFKKWINNAQ